MPGISLAGVPVPSSSPARRLRPAGAIIVAVRSPTPARPAKVSGSAPRATAWSMHSRQIEATAIPAALSPCGSAAAAARAAAFLAAPAISTPMTSRERSQTSPARSKTSPTWTRSSSSAEPSTRAAEPETASLAWAGPPRQATPAPAPVRRRIRRAVAPGRDQALGQHQHGAARADPVGDRPHRLRQLRRGYRQADQVEPGELDRRGGPDVDRLRQRHAGQVAAVLAVLDQLLDALRRSAPRAGPRARRGRGGRRPRSPSCRRRSQRRGASAAGRRGLPTAGGRWARSAP